jgi:glycosyltransferase involved in cell wall biosynthesis
MNTSEFSDPLAWLHRIRFHTGILEQLARHHEVNSIEQINYSGRMVRQQVTYHFLNYEKSKLYLPFRLHEYNKNLDPDIVWVHGFIFPFQVVQLRWALGKNVRIIVQNHAEKPFSGWRKFLQQQADHYVSRYFFTSGETGMEWVKGKIISDQTKIVEVMEASSGFAPRESTGAGSVPDRGYPVFRWVGRLDPNKDPLTVVRSFLEFIKQEPSARLYMIYHTEDLLEPVKKLASYAPQNIRLIGRMPHHQLEEWYNRADFIISGSHYEGSGIAVCEAMSCGCIPVVTNIPSFRKMTGNGSCGLLYRPGNQKELLNALLQTKNLNRKLEKEKTLQQFNKELSFEAIAMKINETIKTLEANV